MCRWKLNTPVANRSLEPGEEKCSGVSGDLRLAPPSENFFKKNEPDRRAADYIKKTIF